MPEPSWTSRPQSPLLFGPELLIGAASPLWAYFTGAALSGVAYWWTARWLRTGGFQALAEAALTPVLAAAPAAAESVGAGPGGAGPVEAAAEALGGPLAEALVGDELPEFPVGGEAAPFGAAVLEAEMISDRKPAAKTKPEKAPGSPPKPRTRKGPDAQPKPH